MGRPIKKRQSRGETAVWVGVFQHQDERFRMTYIKPTRLYGIYNTPIIIVVAAPD